MAIQPNVGNNIVQITTTEAQVLHSNYLRMKITPLVFEGYTMNAYGYTATLLIKQSCPWVIGFRFTEGIDNGTPVTIVCGTDRDNNNYNTLVYKVNHSNSGLCPFICDQSNTSTK
jgi:hypothetical protein